MWYENVDPEIANDFDEVTEGLQNRFGTANFDFIFRQELNARKQARASFKDLRLVGGNSIGPVTHEYSAVRNPH